ncbi:Spindle pole body protein - Sad1p [Klebsormidium nitens]|uniref:Spindle pole body protein-Sad1p n=1 Tax=Klebsormidium nitens TaxID=105231 RepID=A0A1Y1ID01_KLENI|nr:Spindle pole body protein - Sad1p [Klebsormidium nitens]|eukprot:GAQ87822.1 Spindle pole body protein - Sad1p [Klebsormidium nitens]
MKRAREDEAGAAAEAEQQQAAASKDDAEDSDTDADGALARLGGRVKKREVELRRECPYLATVNRQVLDFDFEKFCSVSLSNLNVYGCLVCGKYFQGRGRTSHAYVHSLEQDHHVFVNLHTEKVYCLPDGYEVLDPSLEDIKSVLNPRFTKDHVAHLDSNKQWSRALDGSEYMPGMVGLNNISETDSINVVIQSLLRATAVRDFFLLPANYAHVRSPLVQTLGELVRKVWHPRNFKGQVSPHEFLQAVMVASKKRFRIGAQSDPVEFLSWLLNTLHVDLGGTKDPDSSIIYKCFQGELEVTTETPIKPGAEAIAGKGKRADEPGEAPRFSQTTARMPFLMLGLDLPPPPLFKDALEKNIIPQVPLFQIIKKYDGDTVTENVKTGRKRFRVTKLPRYLILHMKRFTKNSFFIEKNPTIVNFPVKNLELKDYIEVPPGGSKYDLIANITHDGRPKEGTYRAFVHRKSEDVWYELQDLHVTEILPQMVALSEAYLQIYEQQSIQPK